MQIMNNPIIERLYKYIKPFDPEWLNNLKPGDEKDIALLKEYYELNTGKCRLPNSFIEFSIFAGEGDGGLLSSVLKGTFSVKNLAEKIKNQHMNFLENIESYKFPFLTDEMGMDYLIELTNDSKIYYEDTCYISSSFEKLLFQCIVRKYKELFFEKNIYFGSSIKSFRETEKRRRGNSLRTITQELIEEFDLRPVWFNDEYFFYAYGKTASILLLKRSSVSGVVMGDNALQMECIVKNILPIIGAQRQKFI